MRVAPKQYAEAFRAVVAEARPSETKTIIRRLIASAIKRQDRARLPAIVHAIERKTVTENGGRWVEIQTARSVPPRALSRFRRTFSKKDQITTKIDPRLVAGVRIVVNDERALDYSLERKLRKLFTT